MRLRKSKGESTPRGDLLDEAKVLITNDRNNQYGHPLGDHFRVAEILNALGYRRDGQRLLPHDVALIMISLKLSRLTWNSKKRDSWCDVAGYAGCGYETATYHDNDS